MIFFSALAELSTPRSRNLCETHRKPMFETDVLEALIGIGDLPLAA